MHIQDSPNFEALFTSIVSFKIIVVKPYSTDTSKFPFSPRRSAGAPPVFGVCIQWSRLLDSVSEVPVLDGLDFFAAGVGSWYVQRLKEGGSGGSGRRYGGGSGMEIVETGRQEEEETAEKMAEVAIRVLCAGMSVAVSSLTEFALGWAHGYADLIKQREKFQNGRSKSEK
ncbi:hypothetical protein L1887_36202 [Cichorium endivia]|nr:hypothetical protein L1887_36202 [Cichorium endivia]